MAQPSFYLVVSPDPRDYGPVEDNTGGHAYFIKFGDGTAPVPSNTRYSTHNPSYDKSTHEVVWEIAKRPEYIDPLKDEIHNVIGHEIASSEKSSAGVLHLSYFSALFFSP
ncbi:gibberellin cluster-C13-oxidase [Fusarium pseudocircinatum]|uniref:Gibberellin cluster-C13-oxidase n=1 Tax=Fusarium pseudocircinatum TaxID=56676 RepID=A0A8H5PLB5_9HYPO|nr:gibberellin cluster-C13-oxidase [Fusarium pseudocircinatum]